MGISSFWKGVLHSVASVVIMYLPLVHADVLNLTIGGVVTILANWLLSQTVATNTGASARQ